LGEVLNIDDEIVNAIDMRLADEQIVLDSIQKTITIKPVSILDETNIFDSGEIIYSSAGDYGPLTYSVEYFEIQSTPIAYDDWFLYSDSIDEDSLWLDKVSWDL